MPWVPMGRGTPPWEQNGCPKNWEASLLLLPMHSPDLKVGNERGLVPLSPYIPCVKGTGSVLRAPAPLWPVLSEGSVSSSCPSLFSSSDLPGSCHPPRRGHSTNAERGRHRTDLQRREGFVPRPSADASPFQLPADGLEVVAQISHHTLGPRCLSRLAWAGGVSAASSELIVLLQHLDPITQHSARRAGAWERGPGTLSSGAGDDGH